MRIRAVTWALALLVGVGPISVALAARGVRLEVSPHCQQLDVAQLDRLLNVEERRGSDSMLRDARVNVTCADGFATLRVERGDSTKLPGVRRLALADVAGEVGARVLSLAAIELLNDSPARPQPQPPQPEPRPAPSQQPRAPSVRLMAAGGVQSFGLQRPLTGGGISVDYLRLARLGLRLEFGVALGERTYQLGSTRSQLMTLSAQAGYLALHDTWSARAFVGYRFGAARISGTSAPGVAAREGTISGACGGPLIASGLGLRSGSWVAELAAEAGLVSFPVEGRVEGQTSVTFDGYWLGLSVNAGALL